MLSVLLVSTLFASSPAQATECQPSGMGWIEALANALGFESSNSISIYELIAQQNYSAAKQAAHEIAQQAREDNNPATVDVAGYVWQVADKLESAEAALAAGDHETAKKLASEAADIVRDLLEQGLIDQAEADRILKRAGEIWTEAHEALKNRVGVAPILDQHAFDHPRKGVFCGIATTIMMAQANGWSIGTDYADLESLREKMYYPGQGTSGADMAAYLRSQGLGKSYFTTGGTEQDVIESLKSGQPVPFGVVSTHGQIVELREGGSTNYPYASSGDNHHRTFGENGHWVLITGTEGDPDNPSAYIVNDPDLGGQLRVTPSQLSQMGAGSGNFWLVGQ